MIELIDVKKSYGKEPVLRGVCAKIPTGCVFGLVGVNGAGKSTLLRLMAGVLRADSGSILYDGEEVFENTARKRDIFFLPDEPYYASGTTGAQLCALYKSFYAGFDENVFHSRCTLFGLNGNAPLRNFSKGMKRQMFLSAALACRPKYLLLDEAFDGLDPGARLECKRALIDLCGSGCTTVIASHSLRELSDICTNFTLIGKGEAAKGGDLESALASVHKFQAAFEREIEREQLPFDCIKFERQGRLVTFIARGDGEEIGRKLAELSPLFVEEIPVDFEEYFLIETERGRNGK